MTDVYLIEPPGARIPPARRSKRLSPDYSECLMCYRTISKGKDFSIQSHWGHRKKKRGRGDGALFCPNCFKAAFPEVEGYFRPIEEAMPRRKVTYAVAQNFSSYTGNTDSLPKRVLLIEDEPVAQMIHQRFLEDLGYVVDLAEEQFERRWGYDVIVMNIGFPTQKRIETILKIRAWEQEKEQPQATIVVLSGFDVEALKAAYHQAGAQEIMYKPVKPAQLKAVLGG